MEAVSCLNSKRLSPMAMKINSIYQASNTNEKEQLEVVDILEWVIMVFKILEVEIMIQMSL
jgi:hypothetical protein